MPIFLNGIGSAGKPIKRLRLKETVTVKGRDYFGRKSWIRFHPHNQPGWYWAPRPGLASSHAVPIDSSLVSTKSRRLILTHGRRSLNVWEHVGALRFTGLDKIYIESSSSWSPFHGRALELWDALADHLEETDENIPWFTPNGPVFYELPHNRARYLQIFPLRNGDPSQLCTKVVIDYQGVGRHEMIISLPNFPLDLIFAWCTQGYPKYLYCPSKFFSKISVFGWKLWHNHEKIIWAQDAKLDNVDPHPPLVLPSWTLHRFADLLGALSLAEHKGLLGGYVHSHLGGHRTDVGLLKEIHLVGLNEVPS